MYLLLNGNQSIIAAAKKGGVRFFAVVDSETTEGMRLVLDAIKAEGHADKFISCVNNDADRLIDAARASAEMGMPSICIMTESNVGAITSFDVGSGFSYAIVCDDISDKVIYMTESLGIACFIPQTPMQLYAYIYSSLAYSDLCRKPVAVLVQSKFLNCTATVDATVTTERVPLPQNVHRDTRRKMTDAELRRINSVSGSGRYGIAGCGDYYLKALEVIKNVEGIRTLQLDAFTDRSQKAVNEFTDSVDHLLLITSSSYVRKLFGDDKKIKRIAPESDDRLFSEIKKWIPKTEVNNLTRIGYPWDIEKPEVYAEEKTVMCAGCVYRKELIELLDKTDINACVCEAYYCDVKRMHVHSNINDSRLKKYNQVEVYRNGSELLGIEEPVIIDKRIGKNEDCIRLTRDDCKRKYQIMAVNCNGCGECIDRTGCPAIWSRGFRFYIDSGMCNGCGICSRMCSREAIVCMDAEM